MKTNLKIIENVLLFCAFIAIYFCHSSFNKLSYYAQRAEQHQGWIDHSDQMIKNEIKYDSISKT
jgi:hypothetical protein